MGVIYAAGIQICFVFHKELYNAKFLKLDQLNLNRCICGNPSEDVHTNSPHRDKRISVILPEYSLQQENRSKRTLGGLEIDFQHPKASILLDFQ